MFIGKNRLTPKQVGYKSRPLRKPINDPQQRAFLFGADRPSLLGPNAENKNESERSERSFIGLSPPSRDRRRQSRLRQPKPKGWLYSLKHSFSIRLTEAGKARRSQERDQRPLQIEI